MSSSLLLVDGERVAMVMARRAAAEANLDGPHNVHALEEKTLYEMYHWLGTVKERLSLEDWLFAFSDSANFRKQQNPEYQTLSRVDLQDSSLFQALIQNLRRHVPIRLYPEMESCDVMGALMTHPEYAEKTMVGLTADLRLQSVPGVWCGFEEDASPQTVFLEEADLIFLVRVLVGDPAENIAGCPGMRPESARQFLEDTVSDEKGRNRKLWERVVQAYCDAGSDETAALQCARLMRICRFEDYDWQERKVIPWNPPQD